MTRTAIDPLPPPPRPAKRFVRVLGLGTHHPPGAIRQAASVRFAVERCCDNPEQVRWLQRIYEQSTVQRRHIVLINDGQSAYDTFYPPRQSPDDRGPGIQQRMQGYARFAPPLAATAARHAFAQASVEPGNIRQLVTVSCTGFTAPGLDMRLIDLLGLPRDVGRTAIGFMGCHGAVNGLRVASALAHDRPGEPVLLCAVELCSMHFQYGHDRERIVANALFADGAAACVLQADDEQRVPGVACHPRADRGQTTGEQATANPRPAAPTAQWSVLDTTSYLVPDTPDVMTWTIGEHGFRMTLSPRVPALVKRHLRAFLEPWLARHGLEIGDVAHWAVHPGGPRVLDAVEAGLDLPASAMTPSRTVLRDYGNMSSPTVLFILQRLPSASCDGPCVMLAFGPGLMIEAALLMPIRSTC